MSEAITRAAAYDLIDRFLRNNLYDDYAKYSEALEAISQPAPSSQAPGRRKGPPGITFEPQGHESPAAPVDELDELEADMADKAAVMPAAVVAEVYQSRYTIEWVNGPMPTGTNLYAGPKVVKAWAEEVPEDSVCDTSMTAPKLCAFKRGARAVLALRPAGTLTGCNCRWDGETQIEWCELHLAHKDAIHDWAERAKQAEQKLAMRPAVEPMTPLHLASVYAVIDSMGWDLDDQEKDDMVDLVRATEKRHGITAKEEDAHQPTKEAEKP